MVDVLIESFAKKCLEYPEMPIESVFNRFMRMITASQREELKPYYMLMLKTGECARNSIPEIKEMIKIN